MPADDSPRDPHDLDSRLRQLEALHRALGEQIAGLRQLLASRGPVDEAKAGRRAATPAGPADGPPTVEEFNAARLTLLDGYIVDKPGDGDRLLKTVTLRLLDGSSKGFRSADLASARTVARYLIEQAGLRASPRFGDAKLRTLLKKYVPFEPITSLRRLPR